MPATAASILSAGGLKSNAPTNAAAAAKGKLKRTDCMINWVLVIGRLAKEFRHQTIFSVAQLCCRRSSVLPQRLVREWGTAVSLRAEPGLKDHGPRPHTRTKRLAVLAA